jgi:peptidoglycan/xylan/chitin deacetylase (PgdA/CDA1 family)
MTGIPVVAMRSMFVSALRSAAGRIYSASPHLLAQLTGKVVIFMYHRVVPRSEASATFVQPGMYVTPETFGVHLRFLLSQFTVLSFPELLSRWESGDWDRTRRYAVVTFDDGWLDNYRHAYPVLRQLGVPATIFAPTSLIGTDEWLWFDRLGYLLSRHAAGKPADCDAHIERAKTLSDVERRELIARLLADGRTALPSQRRFVNWDEAREMSVHGVSFGSHTGTHASLSRLAGRELERELREPLEILRAQRINFMPVLAYPYGDHTDAVVTAARAAGYRAAVTTQPGAESERPGDLFRLPRVGMHEDTTGSVPLLALHMARQLRKGYRRA